MNDIEQKVKDLEGQLAIVRLALWRYFDCLSKGMDQRQAANKAAAVMEKPLESTEAGQDFMAARLKPR